MALTTSVVMAQAIQVLGLVGVKDGGCHKWANCRDLHNLLARVLRAVDSCSRHLIQFAL